jgi:DNA-binding response OmpR family regulator
LLARIRGVALPVKILVVDDHPLVRRSLRSLLTEPGYQVFEAANGRIAVETVHRVNPDVVVLDIVMPELDGLETARRIRQLISPPKLILISNHYTLEEAVMVARVYGDGNFIQKSEIGNELIPAISCLLRE